MLYLYLHVVGASIGLPKVVGLVLTALWAVVAHPLRLAEGKVVILGRTAFDCDILLDLLCRQWWRCERLWSGCVWREKLGLLVVEILCGVLGLKIRLSRIVHDSLDLPKKRSKNLTSFSLRCIIKTLRKAALVPVLCPVVSL